LDDLPPEIMCRLYQRLARAFQWVREVRAFPIGWLEFGFSVIRIGAMQQGAQWLGLLRDGPPDTGKKESDSDCRAGFDL
jgi:hypothetical protein